MTINKFFVLIPLALLILGGCAEGDKGGNQNNGDAADQNGEVSGGGENEGGQAGGETTGVTLPLNFDPKQEFAAGSGWEYVPNNPQYPDPGYYKTDGAITGLKLNFGGMGIKSSAFAAAGSLKVTLDVGKLNGNTKSNKPEILNVFEVEGYNAAGVKVATAGVAKTEVQAAGEFVVTLTGEAMTSVRIMFMDYPTVGGKCQNINFAGATVALA